MTSCSEIIVNLREGEDAPLIRAMKDSLGIKRKATTVEVNDDNDVDVEEPPRKRRRKSSPTSLSQLCVNFMRKREYKKQMLNIATATFQWPGALEEWVESCPIPGHVQVGEDRLESNYFAIPEVRSNGKLLVKVIDGHHIHVNLRAHICRDTIHGIKRAAWEKVALSGRTKLTKPIVVDGVDKQDSGFAHTMFCEKVEEVMRENGDIAEADFCRLVR